MFIFFASLFTSHVILMWIVTTFLQHALIPVDFRIPASEIKLAWVL
jgi:hypothetical protein